MINLVQILICLLFQYSCVVHDHLQRKDDSVTIHYLGHSCFYIDFCGEVAVLTDYGKPDAYKEYGWSSPIRDIGDLHPDILTYSHLHEDHYDPERAKAMQAKPYFGDGVLSYKGLTINPIGLSEKNINQVDNHAYLFTYQNLRILHLGDCQANIMAIGDEHNRRYLKEHLPTQCHITFVPVEGPIRYQAELLELFQLLDTKIIVPMHFWSKEYKDSLLHDLEYSYKASEFEIVDLSENPYVLMLEK